MPYQPNKLLWRWKSILNSSQFCLCFAWNDVEGKEGGLRACPGMFQSIFTIMSWSTLHAAFLLSFCSQIHCGQGWFEPGAAIKKKTTQPCLLRQFHCFISLFVLFHRSEGWALMRLSHSWSSTTRKGPRSWKRFEAACSPFAAGRVSLMKWGTAVTNTFKNFKQISDFSIFIVDQTLWYGVQT